MPALTTRRSSFSRHFAKFCLQLYRTPASPGHSRDFRVSFIDTVTTLHCCCRCWQRFYNYLKYLMAPLPACGLLWPESFHAKLLLKVVEDSCHHNYLSCWSCPPHDHVLQRHFSYFDLLHTIKFLPLFATFHCLLIFSVQFTIANLSCSLFWVEARPCPHVQCLVSRIIAAPISLDTAPAAEAENRSKTSVDNGLYQGILSGERRGNYHYERGPEESRYCAL